VCVGKEAIAGIKSSHPSTTNDNHPAGSVCVRERLTSLALLKPYSSDTFSPETTWSLKCAYGTGGSFEESLKERETVTPRKPSARSGPGACCAPPLRSVLTAPGFPDRASPFHSSRFSTAALPSPGRPTRRPPGRAGAEGSVIRAGRREFGEWWSQTRAQGGADRREVPPNERTGSEATRERVSSRERRCPPGGMKGRGALAWAETGPIRATEERGYPAQGASSARRAFKGICV